MISGLPQKDNEILRRLAGLQAEISSLPVHREKAELWRRLNDLKPQRLWEWARIAVETAEQFQPL